MQALKHPVPQTKEDPPPKLVLRLVAEPRAPRVVVGRPEGVRKEPERLSRDLDEQTPSAPK